MSEQDEDVAVDTNTEGEEATNSNENSQEETVVIEEEVVPKKQYTQVFARAKKAEADLKAFRDAQAQSQNINNDPQLSEELKLIARGLSDKEIDKAKIVAKGLGISLPEAIKDPLFLSYQNTLKEEKRKEKAKLGASKGSGESQESTLVRPGMSEEEHQEAFKKVLGL
jgi:hypothetical protein